MSDEVDPTLLFDQITHDLPPALHGHVLVVGSIAAAYATRARRKMERVRTKDADIVVQPAGAIAECREIARELLHLKWAPRPDDERKPQKTPDDLELLPVIRLQPPTSALYFIELLAFPDREQHENKQFHPIQIDGLWYCLPSFRYLGLTGVGALTAHNGLAYAAPPAMALSNLLSHPRVGVATMSGLLEGRQILRSAKDLGRVLALWRLARDEERDAWGTTWETALRERFPDEAAALAARAGDGLRELLNDPGALDQALHAVTVGLLNGEDVTPDNLRRLGRELMVDVIDPLAQRLSGR